MRHQKETLKGDIKRNTLKGDFKKGDTNMRH